MRTLLQEAQLMLTNLRDAFIGQSVKVIKHSTIPYIRYSFLLCNSNFVFFVFLRYSTSNNVMTLKSG